MSGVLQDACIILQGDDKCLVSCRMPASSCRVMTNVWCLQDARIYLDVIREFYEAFVIYNFFMYLLLYLEDTYGNVDAFYSTKEDVEHIWGFQYILTPWRMGNEFFWKCKSGVLSYVILRPLMTLTGMDTSSPRSC